MGDQPGQIVKVLDVVKDDQPVTLTGVEPRHASAREDFRGSLPAVLVDSHLDGQLGQTRHESLAGGSVHPRHQRPPGLLAFAGISGGQLRLAHPTHPTHNNRPTPSRRTRLVSGGRLESFLLPVRLHRFGAAQCGVEVVLFAPADETGRLPQGRAKPNFPFRISVSRGKALINEVPNFIRRPPYFGHHPRYLVMIGSYLTMVIVGCGVARVDCLQRLFGGCLDSFYFPEERMEAAK